MKNKSSDSYFFVDMEKSVTIVKKHLVISDMNVFYLNGSDF